MFRKGTWAEYCEWKEKLLASRKDTGHTSMFDYGDVQYLVDIGQGTPSNFNCVSSMLVFEILSNYEDHKP